MIISTTNIDKERGRQIQRALGPVRWGYKLEWRTRPGQHAIRVPTLSALIDGTDGRRYEVQLTDTDIENIVEAREHYKENFQGYKNNK